jgi:hypothetical protein
MLRSPAGLNPPDTLVMNAGGDVALRRRYVYCVTLSGRAPLMRASPKTLILVALRHHVNYILTQRGAGHIPESKIWLKDHWPRGHLWLRPPSLWRGAWP